LAKGVHLFFKKEDGKKKKPGTWRVRKSQVFHFRFNFSGRERWAKGLPYISLS
jgi:hypothetical protein